MDNAATKAFISALSDAPYTFLQPPSALHTAAIDLAKKYLDPLTTSVREAQLGRRQAGQRKRKRGETGSSAKDRVLRLREVHVDGLEIEQIWGQAKMVLDGAVEVVASMQHVLLDPQPKAKSVSFRETDHEEDTIEETLRTSSAKDGSSAKPSAGELNGTGPDDDEDELPANMDFDASSHSGVSDGDQEGGSPASEVGDVDEEDLAASSDREETETQSQDDGHGMRGDEKGEVSTAGADDPTGLNDGFFSIEEFNKQSHFLEKQDEVGEGFNWGGSDDGSVDWHADPMELSTRSKRRRADRSKRPGNEEEEDDDDGPTFDKMNADSSEENSADEMLDGDGLGEETAGIDGMGNANDIRYQDFFNPPGRTSKPGKDSSQRVPRPRHDVRQATEAKASSKQPDEDDIQRTVDAVHRDLFEDELSASDEEDNGDAAGEKAYQARPAAKGPQSTHEQRQAKLADEIRRLEQASVAKKDWTLTGEARAVDRPMNSLLEEDLEFERTGKPVPVITAEVSEDIEELIKRRILGADFDELIRRRPDHLLHPTEARRGRFELDDTKAQQSLAELYEQDHLRRLDPDGPHDKLREQLQQEHDDTEREWRDICAKLDALSNWHYKPKPAKPTIHIVADVPTIAMEDARPAAAAGGGAGAGGLGGRMSMLAPQEIYAPGREPTAAGEVVPKSGLPVARQEMSREDKTKRRRRKKERLRKKLAGMDDVPATANGRGPGVGAQTDVLVRLKRAGVKVIGRKGEVRDVEGKKVKDGPRPKAGGNYKL
ncbi:MAG: U3 snoRNP protein [Phylliscum demangeonii]|nr:MAG: U3 snoRNP protein [Phylliscum demangeonii]